MVWLYRFSFESAPLSLGYFVGLITRLRILKYFANCSLDPLFVCSSHGNGYLSIPTISYGNGFAPAILHGNNSILAILYGNDFCLFALVTSVIREYS